MNFYQKLLAILLGFFSVASFAGEDYERAIRRAYYLLNGTTPTNDDLATFAASQDAYRAGVRALISNEKFYQGMLRYHERVFGVGLADDYLEELKKDSIDGKRNKFASIGCSSEGSGNKRRFKCKWTSDSEKSRTSSCPEAWEQPASVFWYPGVVAWVCPSVLSSCGSDLSRCFITYSDENTARNTELGSTEAFDSSIAVTKSLGKQAAGIAASIVYYNYPYTKILEPGLTAVDGAVAHLYRQEHHFELSRLNLGDMLKEIVNKMKLTHTRFQLINTGKTYEHAGVLSTFGWLRRYEKNRTRANQLYERFMCRKFTSELPRVFPQDPGNLRTTAGCMGCHATLDPLADFFKAWGEGGSLYTGGGGVVQTTFNNKTGSYPSDLADIIRGDNAFATCTVEHVWEYLMGRKFYHAEAEMRKVLTAYFVTTNYSLRELFYALATHPAFTNKARSDATVGDPLEQPPLGEPPGGVTDRPCASGITFATDIQPKISQCTVCHNSSSTSRQSLQTQAAWITWRNQAVNMMASGNMPPGQAGPPFTGAVYDLKEAVRCWPSSNP